MLAYFIDRAFYTKNKLILVEFQFVIAKSNSYATIIYAQQECIYIQRLLYNSINMFLLPWITLNYKYDQSDMKGKKFFGSQIEYVTKNH